MTKTSATTILLAAALTAFGGGTSAFAQGDKALQGRPMGGLAMSMQDEQAMEAASMARAKPTKMHKRMAMKRNMKHNAM